ncbi:MAG: hypothetical protein IT464_15475 [Planctomycetes bacterium]|nr:hypothetical protein [Planctomycetota bacterium]
MKTCMAVMCALLIALFGLSACGGGNDTNSSNSGATNSSNNGTTKEADKPKTPAEERQAVANKMAAAAEAMDDAALKDLFLPEEHANAEKRIGSGWRKMKDEGFTVKAKTPTIEEKDGKFFATFSMTVTYKDGTTEDDTKTLAIVEKEGKYYMSFQR